MQRAERIVDFFQAVISIERIQSGEQAEAALGIGCHFRAVFVHIACHAASLVETHIGKFRPRCGARDQSGGYASLVHCFLRLGRSPALEWLPALALGFSLLDDPSRRRKVVMEINATICNASGLS